MKPPKQTPTDKFVQCHSKTINVVETIYAIFERARLDKQIPANPIIDYDLFGQVDGLLPQEREILTDAEHEQFLAQLEKMPVHESIAFELMVYTGIRSCEVGGLNWSEALLDNRLD